MVRISRRTVAALILAVGLIPVSTASAGPFLSWLFPDDGPEPTYSRFRYWTPALGRVNDHYHGPKLSVYAPDRHPEIPPTYKVLQFPCQPVDPAATLIEPPSPPATSKFKY